MKALLIPIGSHGDVHPFVGLGLALKARGHDVTVLTNEHFESLVRRVGLDFEMLGTEQEFQEAMLHPDIWHPQKAFWVVAEAIQKTLRPTFDFIREQYRPGETVVASGALAFGARVAQEKLGVPLATVQLQPAIFRSLHRMPHFPGMHLPTWAPRFMKKGAYWLIDNLVADRVIGPFLNAFRAELGLKPVRGIMDDWWNSPQLVLGMFPDWYGDPQPDWPKQLKLVGFPLYDEAPDTPLEEDAHRFFTQVRKPIVFTFGSAMQQGHEVFQAAVDACRSLDWPGALLTRFKDQIPCDLPANVRHFTYLPFSLVLPSASVVVHHGGIGSTAQALAAGIPQIVTPFAHDQFDNADRVEELGVGLSIPAPKFRGKRVEAALKTLLNDEAMSRRAKDIAKRFDKQKPLELACDALESLVGAESPVSK